MASTDTAGSRDRIKYKGSWISFTRPARPPSAPATFSNEVLVSIQAVLVKTLRLRFPVTGAGKIRAARAPRGADLDAQAAGSMQRSSLLRGLLTKRLTG